MKLLINRMIDNCIWTGL